MLYLGEVSCAGVVVGDGNGEVHIQDNMPPASWHIHGLPRVLQQRQVSETAVIWQHAFTLIAHMVSEDMFVLD